MEEHLEKSNPEGQDSVATSPEGTEAQGSPPQEQGENPGQKWIITGAIGLALGIAGMALSGSAMPYLVVPVLPAAAMVIWGMKQNGSR